jgi:hypothetical protein
MRGRLAVCLLLLCAGGCEAKIPEGVFTCASADQCPPGWICEQGLCYSSAAAAAEQGPCVPNESFPCTCPDGGTGAKTCDANGKWGKCEPCAGGGAVGQDAGADDVKQRECLSHVPASIAGACKVCVCRSCAEPAMACDAACWGLMACMLGQCPGADPGCVADKCRNRLGGSLDPAMDVINCSLECAGLCQ